MVVAAYVVLGIFFSSLSWILVLGLRSPARYEVEVSEQFQAPLARVYQAIANIPAYPTWRSSVAKIELLGLVETPQGERFSFREFRKGGDARGITYVVTDDTPPSKGPRIGANERTLEAGPNGLGRRVHQIVGGRAPYAGQWIFGLEPRGLTTNLTIIDQGEIRNPLMRGVARLFIPPTKPMNQFLMDLRDYLHKSNQVSDADLN